ncbi:MULTISPECIES: hypothetical protein [unclassified Rhizobium]|uniref:hypothetical protein n=1 Tax=unclassified Rhizobium TaxID=2613769 RepID=UPI0025D0BA64|nr:hypothetical protein [Rhizobium sp. UBA1881]
MKEVTGRMPADRLIAAADMAAFPAQSQMDPGLTNRQALFTTARPWADIADQANMLASMRHGFPRVSSIYASGFGHLKLLPASLWA